MNENETIWHWGIVLKDISLFSLQGYLRVIDWLEHKAQRANFNQFLWWTPGLPSVIGCSRNCFFCFSLLYETKIVGKKKWNKHSPPSQVCGSPSTNLTPSGQEHWRPLGFGRQRLLHPPFKCEHLLVPWIKWLSRCYLRSILSKII